MLLGVLTVLIGLLVILYGRSRRRRLRLPDGAIVYQDLQRDSFVPRTLLSTRYGISGKPDLLIATKAGIVPIELKHSARPPRGSQPHESHRAQLLVYCLLVEEDLGRRVPYGIVRYQGDQDRMVPFDEHNRVWIIGLIEEIRAAKAQREQHRSHNQPARCTGCGCRGDCPEAL